MDQSKTVVEDFGTRLCSSSVPYPNKPGLWKLTDKDESILFEVYTLPGGKLVVWAEDVDGPEVDEAGVWLNDEWLGHLPVECIKKYRPVAKVDRDFQKQTGKDVWEE